MLVYDNPNIHVKYMYVPSLPLSLSLLQDDISSISF